MTLKEKLLQLSIGALAFMPAVSYADCSSQQGSGLNAVSTGACDPATLGGKVGTIIDTLFIVVGSIAVIIMIMGGIRYITSTGDASRVKAAKDTILYAIIGLIVVILARAIVGFVIGKIA